MFDTKDNLYPLAEFIPVIVVFGTALLLALLFVWLGREPKGT